MHRSTFCLYWYIQEILKDSHEFCAVISHNCLHNCPANMVDFGVVRNTRAKSDIWQHFGLKKKDDQMQNPFCQSLYFFHLLIYFTSATLVCLCYIIKIQRKYFAVYYGMYCGTCTHPHTVVQFQDVVPNLTIYSSLYKYIQQYL